MDIKTLSDYDKYLSDIADWEGAITCIETAEKQGIKLVPTGDRLEIVPPEGDYDKDAFNIVVGQLKQNSDIVKAILLSRKTLDQMLSKTQERLFDDNREYQYRVDLMDRLSSIHKKLLVTDNGVLNW